jgi:glycerate kinase
LRASTYGTGTLLQAALDAGAKRIIVGMGGSATVDGGAGCLQALGVRLLGVDAPVGGGGLHKIHTIDVSGLDPRWRETEVIIASDVDNPTLGEQGAAAIFGPQKGASPDDVCVLEDNLRHFFTLVRDQLGVDVLDAKGGGAAGALSAGLMAFLGGRIQSGIDLLLEYNHFRDHLRDADLVITGEGQMDEQTVHGKGPIGVARLAREHGVPTIAIVGGLNADDALLHDAGIQAVLPIVTKPMSLDEAIEQAEELVERAALRLGYLLHMSIGSR